MAISHSGMRWEPVPPNDVDAWVGADSRSAGTIQSPIGGSADSSTWCRRGDLNPHALAGTSPSKRIWLFPHPGQFTYGQVRICATPHEMTPCDTVSHFAIQRMFNGQSHHGPTLVHGPLLRSVPRPARPVLANVLREQPQRTPDLL